MLGISDKILGFSFEIAGFSKICDNRIPYFYTPWKHKKLRASNSSNVNEGIRAIWNLFIFLREDFTRTKSIKRIQANKNKKDSIFMRIKTSKRKKVVCLMFCTFCAFCAFYAFYAHKKHLRDVYAHKHLLDVYVHKHLCL